MPNISLLSTSKLRSWTATTFPKDLLMEWTSSIGGIRILFRSLVNKKPFKRALGLRCP
jgi:hypothetical protein